MRKGVPVCMCEKVEMNKLLVGLCVFVCVSHVVSPTVTMCVCVYLSIGVCLCIRV